MPFGYESTSLHHWQFLLMGLIGIGRGLAASPLPHHRTYGSRIRRFGGVSQRWEPRWSRGRPRPRTSGSVDDAPKLSPAFTFIPRRGLPPSDEDPPSDRTEGLPSLRPLTSPVGAEAPAGDAPFPACSTPERRADQSRPPRRTPGAVPPR